MGKETYKRAIELKKRGVEKEKIKLSILREHISKLRLSKSRDADRYRLLIKNAASGSNRQAIRARKTKEWESYARKIESLKTKMEDHRKRISKYREEIQRAREALKRIR